MSDSELRAEPEAPRSPEEETDPVALLADLAAAAANVAAKGGPMRAATHELIWSALSALAHGIGRPTFVEQNEQQIRDITARLVAE